MRTEEVEADARTRCNSTVATCLVRLVRAKQQNMCVKGGAEAGITDTCSRQRAIDFDVSDLQENSH